MDITLKAGYFIGDLILPLIIGYSLRHTSLAREFFDKMIAACFVVLLPLLNLFTFWLLRYSWDLFWLPLFGVMLHVIPGGFTYLFIRRQCCSAADKGSFILSGMLSNLLTLGGISVYLLYGEVGFAYVQLTVLLQNAILFLFCFPLAQYYSCLREEHRGIQWLSILFHPNQLTVVGMLAGILLNTAQVSRPVLCTEYVEVLIHLSAWLTLIPVGHSLDFTEISQYWRWAIQIAWVKFVLTPLSIYGLAYMLIDDRRMFDTMLILAFAPTAINAVIAVRLHNLNVHLVMAAFVFTTTAYLLLIYPLVFLLLR